MNLQESYAEKGLAITQIELWQQRLKIANEAIIKLINEESKPQVVTVEPASQST